MKKDLVYSEDWKVGKLIERKMISSDMMSLTFSVQDWIKHKAGQHYEIALTAQDGYRAARNYSIASEPEKEGIVEFGIQLLSDGEVSPYLFNMKIGEKVELRGPLGGHFNWDYTMPGPLILIGGGSGIVPLMSMLRHDILHTKEREVSSIEGIKTFDKLPFKDEIECYKKKNNNLDILFAVTHEISKEKNTLNGRIDMIVLKKALGRFVGRMPCIYICGPTAFVEIVSEDLIEMGFNMHEIKTERFG